MQEAKSGKHCSQVVSMAHCPAAHVQGDPKASAEQQCSSGSHTWPVLPSQGKEGKGPAGTSLLRGRNWVPKKVPHLWVALEQWWWVEGPAQQPSASSADLPRNANTADQMAKALALADTQLIRKPMQPGGQQGSKAKPVG